MKAYFNDEEIVALDFEDTEHGPRAKVSYKLKKSAVGKKETKSKKPTKEDFQEVQ